ncbi:DUF6777 domain-containing protein [Streptomyces sp. NPDC086554]|uniref:DUF6777 domain-containing protein n=1 Tax=Streptomyces sp. NPDC086554 TaxID=3154864 RepID=UPI0034135674
MLWRRREEVRRRRPPHPFAAARTERNVVDAQVRFLVADQGKARAFAQASGISQADIPGFPRGLTPVVLRADTRVTNHGYRSGQATF